MNISIIHSKLQYKYHKLSDLKEVHLILCYCEDKEIDLIRRKLKLTTFEVIYKKEEYQFKYDNNINCYLLFNILKYVPLTEDTYFFNNSYYFLDSLLQNISTQNNNKYTEVRILTGICTQTKKIIETRGDLSLFLSNMILKYDYFKGTLLFIGLVSKNLLDQPKIEFNLKINIFCRASLLLVWDLNDFNTLVNLTKKDNLFLCFYANKTKINLFEINRFCLTNEKLQQTIPILLPKTQLFYKVVVRNENKIFCESDTICMDCSSKEQSLITLTNKAFNLPGTLIFKKNINKDDVIVCCKLSKSDSIQEDKDILFNISKV